MTLPLYFLNLRVYDNRSQSTRNTIGPRIVLNRRVRTREINFRLRPAARRAGSDNAALTACVLLSYYY